MSRLLQSAVQRCERDSADDTELFSHATVSQPAAVAASAATALIFDERMELHADSSVRPHPERPDRIRAVVARLMSTALSGLLRSCRACLSKRRQGLPPAGQHGMLAVAVVS